jgi:hypothetical protein
MNFFKKSLKPKPGKLYAVTTGGHFGKFIYFINSKPKDGAYFAMLIGLGREITGDGFECVTISIKDVEDAIKNGIIEICDNPPQDIKTLLKKEWKHRSNDESNN